MSYEISERQVEDVKKLAVQAGDAIMGIYDKDIQVETKDDDSPLTQADLASHNVICTGLEKLSKLPVLSEESAKISWEERSRWKTYWLIDPLDGTKEFIKRNGEFTVNIALIHEHKPIFGVVYSPVLETIYWGVVDKGAFKAVKGEVFKIKPTEPESLKGLSVVGSRSHLSPDMESFLKDFPKNNIVPKGSSLKLCMVAEGAADIYPRLGPTSEWDTGAGHAVVAASGGIVCRTDGTELLYNAEENILNPHFLVVSQSIYKNMFN